MPNTLTGNITTIYNARDIVLRELVGMIPAVSSDMSFARAAVGQTVTSPVVPTALATNITPGVTPPNDGDQIIGTISMTITKSRRYPVRWNGEEKLGLDNNGASFNIILANQFAQGMRTLTNEIEADLTALYVNASRAYGTPGTTPFVSNLSDTAQMLRMLKDNGLPGGDNQLVIDTASGANMRTLLQLSKANESADTSLLRRGVLLDVHGFSIRESGQIITPAIGTGASYTSNAAGYAIGATAITVITGTGTILAGDFVTFAGDTNKYVVAVALTAGVVTLALPGLRKALAASAVALTVGAVATRNMGFTRDSIALATRAPALPPQGDSAVDRMMITDPLSGLTFEVAQYAQYRQMQYEISIAWGVAATKREGMMTLLG